MTVQFSCKGCGLVNVPVIVAERGQTEDLMRWMHLVQKAVRMAHKEISPRCKATTCDLKIPLSPGSERVGGK